MTSNDVLREQARDKTNGRFGSHAHGFPEVALADGATAESRVFGAAAVTRLAEKYGEDEWERFCASLESPHDAEEAAGIAGDFLQQYGIATDAKVAEWLSDAYRTGRTGSSVRAYGASAPVLSTASAQDIAARTYGPGAKLSDITQRPSFGSGLPALLAEAYLHGASERGE